MDDVDRKILAELQKDGRLSLTDLSARVSLSLSPCHRRLRALEDRGVVRGYRAVVDPAMAGLGFTATVFVTLKEATKATITKFETAVTSIPEITQAQRMFGDPDYIMQVMTKDLEAFQTLYDDRLSDLPGVLRLNSTLVMKNVLLDRPLPI